MRGASGTMMNRPRRCVPIVGVTLPTQNYSSIYLQDLIKLVFRIALIPPHPLYGDVPSLRGYLRLRCGRWSVSTMRSTLENRSLRGVFNKTRTLFKQGYRVVFNESAEEAIVALQNQPRSGQSLTMNRYRVQHVADTFRAAFAADKGFTALLLDPDGAIVAGVVGYVHDNLYSPDSVFGSDIDLVKAVDFALMRYLHGRGIDFVNAGMVTSYTESIKGYRVSEAQYYELVAQLPPEPVMLPRGWQDALTVVTASAKIKPQHLQQLVDTGKVPSPLLVVTSSSGERPALQSAKNNARIASFERLLADAEGFEIYEPNRPVLVGVGVLPDNLGRYFKRIRDIEVVPVHKINFMHVTTLSGFPTSLQEGAGHRAIELLGQHLVDGGGDVCDIERFGDVFITA